MDQRFQFEFVAAAQCPTTPPKALGTLLVDENKQVWVPDGLGGHSPIAAVKSSGLYGPGGQILALSEVSAYYTAAGAGSYQAVSGQCELAGWYCSVAAGTITIYDALSATGTPIVPATALAVGPMPIFGPGTNNRLQLQTGCFVVLSGAATVRVAVQ